MEFGGAEVGNALKSPFEGSNTIHKMGGGNSKEESREWKVGVGASSLLLYQTLL